jgi:hypothetical protein
MNELTNTPKTAIVEPDILTANTYFYSAGRWASHRRSNEKRNTGAVENYLIELGFSTTNDGRTVTGKRDNICVKFSYSESCHNVYKHIAVMRDGKRSNITALRKIAAAL